MFSSTYGGRGPDGKVTADEYPLKRLRVLLCFEDEEEAFLACKHFNITVTKRTDKKGKERYIILWRQTEFKEPIDATKGTVVPLQPRKMIKTIEKKLHGASRLAVCRGQVSGKGAFLAPRQIARMSQRSQQSDAGTQQASSPQLSGIGAAEVRTQQDAHARRMEEEDKEAEEKIKRKAAEEEKQKKLNEKEEARRRVEEEQKAKLAAEKQKLDEEKQRSQQMKEQENEKLRIEAENRAKAEAAEKARQDEQRQAEAERARLARIEEQKRKEEERKRAHIENLRKQEEEAKLQREREAEQQRLQAEKKRNEELKAKAEQRKLADEKRRIRLDEERKKKLEIFKRVTEAKRKLSLHLVLSKTRYVRPKRSATKYVPASPRRRWLVNYSFQQHSVQNDLVNTLRSSLSETSGDFRTALVDHFVQAFVGERPPNLNNVDFPTLLRIGIFYHPAEAEADYEYLDAAHHWISNRIDFNKVLDCHPSLRIVFFDGLLQPKPNICNGALLVSPYGRPSGEADIENQLGPLFVSLPEGIPAAVLNLTHRPSNDPKPVSIREAPIFENTRLSLASFDVALEDSIAALAKAASQQPQPEVERISASRFYYECARRAVWHNGTDDDEDNLLLSAIHATVEKAIGHVHDICNKLVLDEMAWPPTEFLSRGSVRDYFFSGEHLPDNWLSLSLSKSVKADILAYSILLDGSLRSTLDLMTADAPISTRKQVLDLLDRRMFRGAVEKALLWRVDRDEEQDSCSHIYLPAGSMKEVLDVALGQLHEESSAQQEQLTNDIEADELDYYQTTEEVPDFAEEITLPPEQPPVSAAPKKRVRYAVTAEQGKAKSQTRGRPSKKVKQEEKMSKRVKAGTQFSRQLEELVNGGTVNMLIGKDGCTLKGLLDRAPKIQNEF